MIQTSAIIEIESHAAPLNLVITRKSKKVDLCVWVNFIPSASCWAFPKTGCSGHQAFQNPCGCTNLCGKKSFVRTVTDHGDHPISNGLYDQRRIFREKTICQWPTILPLLDKSINIVLDWLCWIGISCSLLNQYMAAFISNRSSLQDMMWHW
jgi:hypothetical protein